MTQSPDAAALVALVGSRIAHDLANPIGAIANGVELLGLSGLPDSPELALISESVDNASLRIKLFRLAFGAAAAGQMIPEAQIATLTAPSTDGRKVAIDWQVAGDIARSEAKLAFLALMCLETAMPWGGQARVARRGDRLSITGKTERSTTDPALWAHLNGTPLPTDTVAAAQVHFLLLPAEAAVQSRALSADWAETAFSITV